MDYTELVRAVDDAESILTERKAALRREMETALRSDEDRLSQAKSALFDAMRCAGIAALAERGIVIGETVCSHKKRGYGWRPFEGKEVKVVSIFVRKWITDVRVNVRFIKKDGELSEAVNDLLPDDLSPVSVPA